MAFHITNGVPPLPHYDLCGSHHGLAQTYTYYWFTWNSVVTSVDQQIMLFFYCRSQSKHASKHNSSENNVVKKLMYDFLNPRRYLTILWKSQKHGGWLQKDNRVRQTHTHLWPTRVMELSFRWFQFFFFFQTYHSIFVLSLWLHFRRCKILFMRVRLQQTLRNTKPGSGSASFSRTSIRICSNQNTRTFREYFTHWSHWPFRACQQCVLVNATVWQTEIVCQTFLRINVGAQKYSPSNSFSTRCIRLQSVRRTAPR